MPKFGTPGTRQQVLADSDDVAVGTEVNSALLDSDVQQSYSKCCTGGILHVTCRADARRGCLVDASLALHTTQPDNLSLVRCVQPCVVFAGVLTAFGMSTMPLWPMDRVQSLC